MALMCEIFGMFSRFINAHMTISRNMTPNITKGQKWVREGSKVGKKTGKMKISHRKPYFL